MARLRYSCSLSLPYHILRVSLSSTVTLAFQTALYFLVCFRQTVQANRPAVYCVSNAKDDPAHWVLMQHPPALTTWRNHNPQFHDAEHIRPEHVQRAVALFLELVEGEAVSAMAVASSPRALHQSPHMSPAPSQPSNAQLTSTRDLELELAHQHEKQLEKQLRDTQKFVSHLQRENLKLLSVIAEQHQPPAVAPPTEVNSTSSDSPSASEASDGDERSSSSSCSPPRKSKKGRAGHSRSSRSSSNSTHQHYHSTVHTSSRSSHEHKGDKKRRR